MAVTAETPLTNRKPEELTPHPRNEDIYTNDDISKLKAKIDEYGFQEEHRILITPDNEILSGHRRWNAAKELGLDQVPVEVKHVGSEREELLAILLANRYRNKTPAEKINEAEAWAELEKEDAMQRERSGGVENFPQGSTGKTRDKAAEKVGISGRTYEKGQRVKDAAADPEKAEEKGLDHDTAKEQWEQMESNEQSIHGAYEASKTDDGPDEIEEAYGPETHTCTVCGEDWYGWDFLERLEGEFVPVEQICIVDWPDEFVLHFPPEVINEHVA